MTQPKSNDAGGNGHKAPAFQGAAAPAPRKRFYKTASVVEDTGANGQPLYRVVLDGRSVRTPARRELAVPHRSLAEALAAEWEAQREVIEPAKMPLTRLVNSALDGVVGREAEVRADIVKFAGNDLVCYLAEEPAELVARQREAWGPIHRWLEQDLGARLKLATGIMPIAQDASVTAAVERALAGYSALPLTGLHVMTTLTGSAALALACARGAISAEEAWALAHIDEDFQIEKWGEDAEATARRAARWAEMEASALLVRLSPSG